MSDKYSLAACEQYGRRLAARLCQQYFDPQPEATLDGPALLKLTPMRQLNLLVLHQLLGRWQHEAEQLRSPYFDFEASPVRAALGQFMNVLSRHLRVGRAALEPLLAQAAAATLLLALDPTAAFEQLLLPPAPAPEASAAYLQERLRYLDLGKELFEGFVASLPAEPASLGRAELRQRFEQYRATHLQQLPTLAPLLAELSALLPVSAGDLQAEPSPPPPPAAPAPPAEAQHPAAALAEARAQAADPAAAEPAEPAAPVAAPTPSSSLAPKPTPTAPAAPTSAEPPAPSAPRPVVPSFVAPEPAPGVPLYEKLKAAQPAPAAPLAATLRDPAAGGTPSLAERSAPKVGSLREAISINQRYSFINELFSGENMDYHAAIAHLDELPSLDAAVVYVQQELAPRHDWGRKEEHVARLLKLIERKFAPGA